MTAPDLEPLPFPTPRSFHYEEVDRVGIITLDRPDRFNALTFAVYRELTDLFTVIDRRALEPDGARALVLQGEGRAFCGGGDVDDIITRLFERDSEALLRFTRMTGELIHAMRRCQLPIVASVKRVAAGAGALVAAAGGGAVLRPGAPVGGAGRGGALPAFLSFSSSISRAYCLRIHAARSLRL